MTPAITQSFPLGLHWPTIDPFLFCAHHLDHYPAGDGHLAPAADLTGRELGNDFVARDGFRMYHGHPVPGFPQHPHRGFETISIVCSGLVDHADSLGARARYGDGDVQWLTAGRGIQHAEMFPLVHDDRPNPLELIQIWLNLPRSNKMDQPHFSMFWASDIPTYRADGVAVTVVAGRLADAGEPLPPPPSSWAAHDDADVAVWLIDVDAGAKFDLPAADGTDTHRVLYNHGDGGAEVDSEPLDAATGALVNSQRSLTIAANGATRMLMLQGRPIGEPVVQQGPFVMTTRDEVADAFVDYRATQFGGWPYESPAPTHGGADVGRFVDR